MEQAAVLRDVFDAGLTRAVRNDFFAYLAARLGLRFRLAAGIKFEGFQPLTSHDWLKGHHPDETVFSAEVAAMQMKEPSEPVRLEGRALRIPGKRS